MTPNSDQHGDMLASRDVLAAIYDAILSRAPDQDGLRYWCDVLANGLAGRRPAADMVSEILTAFIATPEGHRKLVASLAGHPDATTEIRAGDAARAAVREAFLLPDATARLRGVGVLGVNCYPASLLARFGARSWSGPFDWVFSTPAMVRDCIRDGFDTFLDPSEYRPVPIEERADPDYNRVSHPLFERRYAIPAPIFNHTDAHLPEGQNYLRRCVDRFEAALRQDGPLRLLQIDKAGPDGENEFRRTLETLRTRCARPRLVQVAVHQARADAAMPTVETLHEDPAGRLLAFRPTSAWNPTRFDDLLDDLVLMRAIEAAFAGLD